jgi:hypothetical protein
LGQSSGWPKTNLIAWTVATGKSYAPISDDRSGICSTQKTTMRTAIQPQIETINEVQVYGFYVGIEFVSMRPHKGYVDMAYSWTGRPTFLKSGNRKNDRQNLKYRGNRIKLEILQLVPENVIEVVVQSQGQFLCVLPSEPPVKEVQDV